MEYINEELMTELNELRQVGTSDVKSRALIAISQFGDFVRFTNHDQKLNPTVRPHGTPAQEVHAAGHVIVQMLTYIGAREIDVNEAVQLALQDLREGNVLKRKPSDGVMACGGTVRGEAIVIRNWSGITCISRKAVEGKILVTTHATPEIPLHLFAGIITDEGGFTCHAGILSREKNIPCVVGMGDATERFKTGDVISINDGNVRVIGVPTEDRHGP
jgi:phosphohistidine swiveling domain-containing protein